MFSYSLLLVRLAPQVQRRGNMRRCARLRDLTGDARRSCAVFDDLHCRWTAPLQEERQGLGAMLDKALCPMQALTSKAKPLGWNHPTSALDQGTRDSQAPAVSSHCSHLASMAHFARLALPECV
jgi:hypothetical protein